MSFVKILGSLLEALAYYWKLKSDRYEHDLREMSRSRIEALEDQLTDLRNDADSVDTIAADRVLYRILAEKEYFKSLPGTNPADRSGDDHTY